MLKMVFGFLFIAVVSLVVALVKKIRERNENVPVFLNLSTKHFFLFG